MHSFFSSEKVTWNDLFHMNTYVIFVFHVDTFSFCFSFSNFILVFIGSNQILIKNFDEK